MAAKAKTKVRRKRGMPTIPVAVVAGFIPTIRGLYHNRASWTGMGYWLMEGWTGIDPGSKKFIFSHLWRGALPVLLGGVVHMVANRFGVNRALSRARIPVIRL